MNGSTMKTQFRSQQGFLAITLIIIILIVGFIGAAIAYMLRSSGQSVGHSVQSNQALSLAEAGLSKGTFKFKLNPIYPCSTSVTGTNPSCPAPAWSTPETLGRGQFQYLILTYTGPAWSASYTPAAPTTKTKAPIVSSSSPQVVRVNSIANLAPQGQVIVSTNPVTYLNYTGTSMSSSTCGSTYPCLTGVVYSGSSTISSGSTVSQNQTVLSTAVNPSSSPQVIRIANATNLAPLGQVLVGTQVINYAGISNSTAICGGTGPCLIGASYPSGSTLPANSRVSQNQVVIQAKGGVPNLSNPQGNRAVMAPIMVTVTGGDGGGGSGCTNHETYTSADDEGPGGGYNPPITTTIYVGGWTEIVN